ncbi:SDR family NAD(P)-dependent oxidoreductase [Nocardioides piscis]|uniref:Glucose 1-dehydrogenase n=1 Tax=Nocardioides piscis TaxID=2714938 RepID=A0A6G7YH65_9ACTN|nr:glucose 1-dehydrogenase [Nocardioides piscis]QIK76152.1 glucose 1-dehydrogenase [Nocardioides piscis]
MRLAGKVAVVTGAGDGIGAAVARAFAAEGAKVVVAELSEDAGRAVATEIGGTFVRTDVGKRDQVEAMVRVAVETWGSVDILVNNAWGAGNIGRVEHKTDEMVDNALAVGFRGPLWAMQAAFPHMLQRGWGRVINMCSLNGVNAHVGTLEYNAAKEALRTLTRTAAREWAPTGVVVNAVCPGAKSAAFRRVVGEHPELEEQADRGNPMGRLGDPLDDIAPVAVFLASDDCRYLTGNTLFVDGGAHINGVAWQPELP